jgi:hypothetical protein
MDYLIIEKGVLSYSIVAPKCRDALLIDTERYRG